MASDKKILAKVHKIFASEVERFYTDRRTNNRSGSIAFVQRFGSALNLNVHFHMLQIEGLYEPRTTDRPKFRKGKSPTNKDIESLVSKISKRVVRLLRRTGARHSEQLPVILSVAKNLLLIPRSFVLVALRMTRNITRHSERSEESPVDTQQVLGCHSSERKDEKRSDPW